MSQLLAAILACVVIYAVVRLRGNTKASSGTRAVGAKRVGPKSTQTHKPKPFDVKSLTPAELRIRYKQFLAKAALYKMDGKESGISAAEAKEATEKAVLCKAQLAILSDDGPASADIQHYREQVLAEIKASAEGR